MASQGADIYLVNDGDGDLLRSPVKLLHNDFDQRTTGIFMQIPFGIDPSNLNNVDPLFVDALKGDYHLTADSPLINQGTNDAPALPTTDKDGIPRIIDGIVDIGSYEFGSAMADLALLKTAEPDPVPVGSSLVYSRDKQGTCDCYGCAAH